jgi:branched-chain amino acid aminotransferase
MKLRPSVNEVTLRQRVAEIVKDNLPHESRVRLILAKDSGEIFVLIQFFKSLPESVYSEGVHVITSTVERHDPRIKGTDFITKSAEQRKLVGKDVFEILLTHNGMIFEGMTSNFYAVKGKNLITAQKGILLGVTRRAVLRIARGQGMSIEYRSPLVNEKFDEAFLTSSSRGVVPIVSIDDVPVGQGRVGAWAKCLSEAYQAYVQERSEKIID